MPGEKQDREQYPLGPYRVLDLTDESGVFCTKLLASMGADVIRIEPPGGHETRKIGPFYHDEPDPEKSLHWFVYNLGKRSITLDINSDAGKDIFKRLVRTADFVVECFPPGHLDKIGLGYSDLNSVNPRIIHTSITPFGSTGPYSHFKGSCLICTAMSGYLYVLGDEDRPPVQIAVPVAYTQAGLLAASSTLVAHWFRRRTGEGQHADISIQESIMSQTFPMSLQWKSIGHIPARTKQGPTRARGGRTPEIFKCKDGLMVGALTPARGRQQLRGWLASEGMEGDLLEPKWDDIFLKGAQVFLRDKTHIDQLFQAFASKHSRDELMLGAQKRGIQLVKMQGVPDVVNDVHLREREYFVKVEHPELKDTLIYTGAPVKSEVMSWPSGRRAPLIGEDNEDIYIGELGLSRQEMAALEDNGVI